MDKETIHNKGFNISDNWNQLEYGKIKVGTKTLTDATLDLGAIQKTFPRHQYTSKAYVWRMMADRNLEELRAISNFYYSISGIYERVCNYFATLYRFDWYVTPTVYDDSIKDEKMLKEFNKVLEYLDASHIKKLCGDIALEVIKNGVYYAYIVPSSDSIIFQQLPAKYCRVRYYVNNTPAVEFDMRFFDTFTDINYRLRILDLFPDEFKKGYILYKKGKIQPDCVTDNCGSWYLLEPGSAVKFNFNGSDVPMFVNAIPAILDLDAAQDLDRRK